MASLFDKLTALLNKFSEENGSDTPDYVLASFLIGCLKELNLAVNRREMFYGREPEMQGIKEEDDVDTNAKR